MRKLAPEIWSVTAIFNDSDASGVNGINRQGLVSPVHNNRD